MFCAIENQQSNCQQQQHINEQQMSASDESSSNDNIPSIASPGLTPRRIDRGENHNCCGELVLILSKGTSQLAPKDMPAESSSREYDSRNVDFQQPSVRVNPQTTHNNAVSRKPSPSQKGASVCSTTNSKHNFLWCLIKPHMCRRVFVFRQKCRFY